MNLRSILEMPFSTRQRKLAASRSPMDKEDFIQLVASSDVGRRAGSLLWDKLNSVKVRKELTPYPDDDLLRVYGLADEDLDEDVVLRIIEELEVPVPDHDDLEAFGPVKTPCDVVRLIESVARKQ